MRLFRMTNARGELIMIAPAHTFLHFRLLSVPEVRHLERLPSGGKWTAQVVFGNYYNAEAEEFQFEILPLEIALPQSGSITAARETVARNSDIDYTPKNNGDTEEWSV